MSAFLYRPERRWQLGCGLLVAAHVGLLLTFRLDESAGWTLSLIGLAFIGLLMVAIGGSRVHPLSGRVVLLVAVTLRLILLPLPATLSDDLHRYVWDGKVVAAGFDPYELAPEDERLASLRDDNWQAVSHKDVPTVYPPLAQLLFSIAARLPGSLYVLKGILACLELVGCALLVALARRRGLSNDRVVWYAWNPLVVIETAGMGHIDAVGVAATIAAVLWLTTPSLRLGRAAVAAGMGVLAKLVPVLAVPLWMRLSGRPVRFLLVTLSVTVIGSLPVALSLGTVPPGLLRYAVSWEFNGPLFEPLWRLLEAVGAPDAAASFLDWMKASTGRQELWNRFYHYRYPQFLAKVILWALLAVMVALSVRQRDAVAGTGRMFGWMVLCSATVYPWYLLWVLPWAALCRQPAWLALSALIQLCYLPQLLGGELFPWYYLAIWMPFLVLLVWHPRWSID